MPSYSININKSYNIPKSLPIVRFDDKILVIDVLRANWIVLDSEKQLDIFKSFQKGISIESMLKSHPHSESDINYVVTQIEARQLYNQTVQNQIADKTLHFYLTNGCNLLCPHCYMFSGTPTKDELKTTEIKKVLSDFSKIAGGKIVTFSGGEPTLRKDFDDIVEYAYDLGLEIKLMTNGTTLNPDRISALARFISSVQVSIDGFSEKSNAEIRGAGNFQKSLETVDAFIANNVYTSIAITPKYDVLRDNHTGYLFFARELESRYEGKAFELRFSEELLRGRCISDVSDINKEYGKSVSNILHEIYGDDYEVMEFVKMLMDNPIIENCSYGEITVAANGDVFLCPRISDLKPIG
ncbi:MAG: radical SAM protein, partial [Bacteroides sp.]|nr:radical SAM protein [Bacteroides sp.]